MTLKATCDPQLTQSDYRAIRGQCQARPLPFPNECWAQR